MTANIATLAQDTRESITDVAVKEYSHFNSLVSDTVSHSFLLDKMSSVQLCEPLNEGSAQKVVVYQVTPDWWPVFCVVPQGSILGPVIFKII